jgi:hypothetical protein
MNSLITLQLAAHLLADFNFQSQKWCDAKDAKIFSKEHLYHTLVVFVCSWILSFSLAFWWAAVLITIIHLGIDSIKSYFAQKKIWERYLFFIDQLLHVASIVSVVWLFSKCQSIDFPVSAQDIFIVFALIACTKSSNIFIKKYMEANDILPVEKGSHTLLKAGRIIGSLERIVSFILIAFNQFAAVGFIMAAKSILRFKDTDTAKSEYLLIGSLLSFGIAILLGIVYYKLGEYIGSPQHY